MRKEEYLYNRDINARMVDLSIKLRFSAAHNIKVNGWSARKNREIFKECYSKYPHGHNYKLEVRIRGNINEKTGMVVNFHNLEEIVYENVIKELNMKYLNKELEYFQKKLPTIENIVLYLWEELESFLEPLLLVRIRLYQDDTLYVETGIDI